MHYKTEYFSLVHFQVFIKLNNSINFYAIDLQSVCKQRNCFMHMRNRSNKKYIHKLKKWSQNYKVFQTKQTILTIQWSKSEIFEC